MLVLSRNTYKTLMCLILLFFVFTSFSTSAGGIALGATRIIYPLNAKQVSLAVTNSDEESRFLIQSWVDDENEKKSPNFIVTPPLFVSKPKSENTLRIMYVGPELPKDRESIFWLSSKAIPAVERNSIEGKNVLQLAILSRIKIFVRPENLGLTSEEALSKLDFYRRGNAIEVKNASPYYITLVNLRVGVNMLPNTMIAPMSSALVNSPKGIEGVVTYQTVNDYGANTPITTVQLK